MLANIIPGRKDSGDYPNRVLGESFLLSLMLGSKAGAYSLLGGFLALLANIRLFRKDSGDYPNRVLPFRVGSWPGQAGKTKKDKLGRN